MTIKVNDAVVVQQNMISRHRPVYAVGQNILVKRERGGTWHTIGIIGGRVNENVICHNVGGEWIAQGQAHPIQPPPRKADIILTLNLTDPETISILTINTKLTIKEV